VAIRGKPCLNAIDARLQSGDFRVALLAKADGGFTVSDAKSVKGHKNFAQALA
jgi:hypothetical protein